MPRVWVERLLAGLMAALTVVVLVATTVRELRQGFPSYGISEWLISYDAGFVRRGLWGTLIHAMVDVTGLSPILLVVMLSLVSFVALAIVLWATTRRMVPMALMLSPVLLGSGVFGYHFIDKDFLLLLLLAACAASAVRVGRSRWWLVPLNAAGALGVLTHETFAVFALPAVVVILAGGRFSPTRLLRAVAAIMPVIAAFALVFTHHGTNEDARLIDETWNVDLVSHRACCLGDNPTTSFPDSATGYLGESLAQAFDRGTSVFSLEHGWQNSVLPWVFSWIAVGIILVVCSAQSRRRLLLWFALQSGVCFPLWLIGWDDGRWIAITAVSAVLLTGLAVSDPLPLPTRIDPATWWSRTAVLLFACLLFGLPGNGWSVQRYVDSTPLISAWHALDDIRYWT